MTERTKQSAYEHTRTEGAVQSLRDRVYSAMYGYLVQDLGRDPEWARGRAEFEAEGTSAARVCDELEQNGIRISGRRILDLGAGLGALTSELARRNGELVSIEPGEGWRQVAAARLAEAGVGQVVGAVGEALPLADNSFDVIVSLQVLEHVRNPVKVIRELYRVLKPGGYLFIAYENYLGFREPHYGVGWLPLLPKRLGASYLKLRGRNPRFLLESVTYTTFPAVRREMFRSGFVCMQRERWRRKLKSKTGTGLKWRLLNPLSGADGGLALALLSFVDFGQRAFRTFTEEFMQKPGGAPER